MLRCWYHLYIQQLYVVRSPGTLLCSVQAIKNPPSLMTDDDRQAFQTFSTHYDTAELYYAYSIIHAASTQPFKTVDDATLFNTAR